MERLGKGGSSGCTEESGLLVCFLSRGQSNQSRRTALDIRHLLHRHFDSWPRYAIWVVRYKCSDRGFLALFFIQYHTQISSGQAIYLPISYRGALEVPYSLRYLRNRSYDPDYATLFEDIYLSVIHMKASST